MKRFLFAIMAIVAVISVKAATVTGALTGVQDPVITYQSVDVNNNPITLSAKLYYKNEDINFVMMNCHATITHNDGCPTGDSPQMEAVKYMVSEGCLLICPDYIGFGQTRGVTHPYMCSTLTGRNVLDAYKAAIKYFKDKSGKKIKSSYYTINVGYSQGGATALAFQRYLETEASDADRALVNLKGSVCGAGPYNQQTVFDVYEKGEGKFTSLDYPIYLLYTLNGHKAAFGKSIMRKLELEECFTPEFWAYCQNGFMDELNAKEKDVDVLNDELKNAGFKTFYSIINADYADRNSKVYRTIHKVLEQSNLLADGWTPSKNIIFYHDHAGNDIVVPYACTQAAMTRFAGHCSYVDAVDDYDFVYTVPFMAITPNGDNFLWHAAVFGERWSNDLGWVQDGIKGIAGLTGQGGYSFSQLDHRTFGARFYCQFLAERQCMRPSSSVGQGTAYNTNIAPETPTIVTIGATDASVEGKADRIEMALPYAMQPNAPIFLQFPAKVDGYYFGCDAKRYEVTLNAAGEAVDYTEMDDLADFEPGKVYLVESEDADEAITIVSPAQKKDVVACDLKWRELNMRKTRTLEEKSYVSNYMPFAYTTAEGATAYAMTPHASGEKVVPKAFTTVPVGTGTLIEDEGNANILVLYPTPASEGEAISDNLLIGNYTEVDNDTENYYHFGISIYDNIGYWRYPNLAKVRAFSSYMNIANASAKGFEISFDDDATAIEGINAESKVTAVWGIDGSERPAMQKGINLVRTSDGIIKKVLVK